MPRYKDIYISTNNLRMDFPIFDIPPITTCPGSTPLCRQHCYALKSERLYPNTRRSRKFNYIATLHPDFTTRMISYIARLKKFTHFRLHSSGDFYSQEYLDKWVTICKASPHMQFLVYTQQHHLNYNGLPPNVVLYHSIWPDSPQLKFSPNTLKAYVIDSTHIKLPTLKNPPNLTQTFKCPKTHTKGKCNDCMHCFNGIGDVKFELH